MDKYIELICDDLTMSNYLLKSIIDKKLLNDGELKKCIVENGKLMDEINGYSDLSYQFTTHLLDQQYDYAFSLMDQHSDLRFDCGNLLFDKCDEYSSCYKTFHDCMTLCITHHSNIKAEKFIDLIKYILKNGFINAECTNKDCILEFSYVDYFLIALSNGRIDIAKLLYMHFDDINVDSLIIGYINADCKYSKLFADNYDEIHKLNMSKDMTQKRKCQLKNYIEKRRPDHFVYLKKIFDDCDS